MSQAKKKDDIQVLNKVISYCKDNNNEDRMQYYKFTDTVLPSGSGATEAACKVIVKQRMCKSGMRWKEGKNEKWHAQMPGLEVVFMKQNGDLFIITLYHAGRSK